MVDERAPCPMRIVEDCGYAYVVGLAGGGFFHSLKGMKQAPKGFINGWKGAYSLAKFKSPQTAGSFAIFGTLFSTTECALVGIRNKDDMLNPIISGFVTSASLSFRNGIPAMISNGMFGVIEFVAYNMNKMQSDQFRPLGQQEIIQEQEKLKSLKQNKQPETNSGWFESFLPNFGMSSKETGNNNNSIH